MTSILKVDQLQDSGGNAIITSDGAGNVSLNTTMENFVSKGIDDNATANALTLDSSGNLQFNSGYGSVATAYGVRAWVNFNGTETVAINASGNISSITDIGTATYELNFANNMSDANYAIGTTARQTLAGGTAFARLSNIIYTSRVRLYCIDNSDNPVDPVTVTAIISR